MSLSSVRCRMVAEATETLTTGVDSITSPTVTHNVLGAWTTISPATQIAVGTCTMTAGTGSIDLTSLTGVNGSIDGTGLKLQYAWFKAKSDNANAITIADGARNGYAFLGESFTFDLTASQQAAFFGNDASPDVASDEKIFDVTGTGAQAVDYVLILG